MASSCTPLTLLLLLLRCYYYYCQDKRQKTPQYSSWLPTNKRNKNDHKRNKCIDKHRICWLCPCFLVTVSLMQGRLHSCSFSCGCLCVCIRLFYYYCYHKRPQTTPQQVAFLIISLKMHPQTVYSV